MITASEPDGPADVGGSDVATTSSSALDGEPVTGVDDLIRLLNAERIGRAVSVDVLRRGQLRSFELHPTERRASDLAGASSRIVIPTALFEHDPRQAEGVSDLRPPSAFATA